MDHNHNPYAPEIPPGQAYEELRLWRGALGQALTAPRVKECYFWGARNDQVAWRSGNRNEIDGGWLDRLAMSTMVGCMLRVVIGHTITSCEFNSTSFDVLVC